MKVSLSWLRQFVEAPPDPVVLRAALIAAGIGVETVTALDSDVVFDLEVTTNRPDCLNHYGVAREVAAAYRTPLKPLWISVQESGPPAAAAISIEIADPDLCARYCGRIIRGVEVKPSPEWLRVRLEAVGIRSINNVADATNYVLMELGHPLHAFDLAKLRESRITVRRARPGEHLRTLDGVDRALSPHNLVIADGRLPVALAGVMGGEESEISSATRDVLLESAWFDPLSIRRTSKTHGLHTEASHRFERGADIEMAPVAINRTAQLIAELAAGEVLPGVVDVCPRPREAVQIVFRASEIRRHLGAEIPAEEVERILRALGFVVAEDRAEAWRVCAPSFRLDVKREIDLVEEIARIHGYDRLPARVRAAPPRVEYDSRREREKELEIARVLTSLGYREIIAPSLVNPSENACFSGRTSVVLQNPLSQEASAMRASAVPSMLRALGWNLDRNQHDLRFCEIGKVYEAKPGGTAKDRLPAEHRVLTLGLSGDRRAATVHETSMEVNFFDLKGDLESLLPAFEIEHLVFKTETNEVEARYYEAALSGRFVDLPAAGGERRLAVFGALAHDYRHQFGLRQPVWIAEVDLDRLLEYPLKTRCFRSFSRFPAVERDFSLILPDAVKYAQISRSLDALGLAEIRSFRPVDWFRGGGIPAGHYSLLLRVAFQSSERTLTGEEVDEHSRRLLSAIEPLGARLRA